MMAHQALMPGGWNQQYVHSVAVATMGIHANDPSRVLSGSELALLSDVLQLNAWRKVLDPFYCLDSVSDQVLDQLPVVVFANTMDTTVVADMYSDPLQPVFWSSLPSHVGARLDAVVCCPHPAILDVALPLMSLRVPCVCALVPFDYLVDVPAPRASWLQRLKVNGRLQIIKGVVSQPGGMQHCVIWLCVFRDAVQRSLSLKPAYNNKECVVHVVV